jgi:hypothetical protein
LSPHSGTSKREEQKGFPSLLSSSSSSFLAADSAAVAFFSPSLNWQIGRIEEIDFQLAFSRLVVFECQTKRSVVGRKRNFLSSPDFYIDRIRVKQDFLCAVTR